MEPKRDSLIKVKKNGYPGPGTVKDLVEKFEKTGKMAKQKRNVSLGNEGQVRTRIMQYEERLKGEGKPKKDSLGGIRRNPAREAKEVALARIVEIHKFEMSDNGYEERIKGEGKQKDSLEIRRNPTTEAKKVALARIVEIHKFEMSYQAARVALIIRQFENMLRETMTENSPGTEADCGSFCGDYGETMMGKILARKQRTYLRREAKDRALLRIRRIAMDEVSPNKRGLVYDLVQLWEEALKGEKIDKKNKIVIEVIEEGIVKRSIQYLENIIRGNIQEDDLRGQSRDFRNHLRRVAKDIASAQIRKIVEEEMASEKRGIVYNLTKRYETALKGDKIEAKNEYQEARKSQTLENFIEYFENRLQEKTETEGDLLGQSSDFRENLNRKAKDIPLARISQIIQEELSEEQNEKLWKSENIDEKTEIEGDLLGQSPDFRETLNRKAKDITLARISQIIQEELSEEQNEKLWKSENIDEKTEIEGDLLGQSPDFRENLNRKDKDITLARISQIIQEELSEEQNEKLGKSENIDEKTEIEGDLLGQSPDFRETLNRKAKDITLARISQIIQEELSEEQNEKLWKSENIDEKTEIEGDLLGQSPDFRENLNRKDKDITLAWISQIIQEELSEEQNEKLWKSENIDEKTEIEGDLLGQSPDFRENLNRKAKDIALARISQIIQEWLSEEQNEKGYQESNSPGTKADSASKGGEYAEIMMMNGMMKRKHLRREAKDVALIRIRQIAQEEISQQKGYKVYALIKLWEEAVKHEKTDKRQEVNLEEIEEGIVERGIQYFENIIRGIIVSDCCQAIEWGLQGLGAHEELSEQNENVWKSENIEKELQDYQEANSSGTQGYSVSNSDDYEEIIKLKVMGRKQTADLRRKAKDRAFFKIRRIAMEEVFPEKRRLVYGLVQVWEEALKGEKIEKMKKVIHEVIEKGNVKRHIQKFENAIRGNLKEGDLGGQPRDFRNHLRRTTKDKALAQIRKLVQEEMSEKTGRVYDLTELHENAIKGDKIEKKSEYKAIKSQTLENLIEYFENILQKNSENEGNLHGQSRDLGSHFRRAVKDIALARIRNILQEAIEEENFEE
ncbi:trichohyalin-like [Palaemon carinicauda]|uniref:trichohyalin-like n=1 Tax=Palaemon carinicauda TaxID=392227 RepID=UPI0035B5B7BB